MITRRYGMFERMHPWPSDRTPSSRAVVILPTPSRGKGEERRPAAAAYSSGDPIPLIRSLPPPPPPQAPIHSAPRALPPMGVTTRLPAPPGAASSPRAAGILRPRSPWSARRNAASRPASAPPPGSLDPADRPSLGGRRLRRPTRPPQRRPPPRRRLPPRPSISSPSAIALRYANGMFLVIRSPLDTSLRRHMPVLRWPRVYNRAGDTPLISRVTAWGMWNSYEGFHNRHFVLWIDYHDSMKSRIMGTLLTMS